MWDIRFRLVSTLALAAIGCGRAAPVDSESVARRVAAAPTESRSSALSVGRLRWDASEHPIGILRLEPRLEWRLSSTDRGQTQSAYQVLVASDASTLASGKPDLWDSGKVQSSDSINVSYTGPSLLARQHGVWTVRVWDKQDHPSPYAAPAHWEVGPWDEEVEGDWIGRARKPGENETERERSVSYFRKAFTLPEGFQGARLYATAFGLYELSINGERVSDDVLAPGFTDYEKRVLMQTRDVTSLLRAGENVLGGVLAGGWCTARFRGKPGRCGAEPPRLRAVLEVTLADGTRQTLESDDTWKYAAGPLQAAQLFEGETYDARRALPGWDRPGFDDRGWLPAVEYDEDTERNVYPDPGTPTRIAQEQPSLTMQEPSPGSYVFDLGRVIVGWPRLTLEAPAGTNVSLRYAEQLRADGSLASDATRATDRYIAAGSGSETWEPRFSLRRFRYVEVRGLQARPTLATIVGRSVRSDMPSTGSLQTSDETLNRFFASIQAEQERAFVGVPSLGAAYDSEPGSLLGAQVFALTSCLNRDVQRFYRKWLDDIRDAQLPSAKYSKAAPDRMPRDGGAAASAGVLVPWALYRCYDDRAGLDSHITSMGRWLDAIVAENPDFVWRKNLGDSPSDPLESGARTDPSLMATAELAYSADALAHILRSGGTTLAAESERFQVLAKATRAAFNAQFVLPNGKLVSDTQTAYAVAIARGMLEGEAQARAGEHLAAALERAQRHPTTGVLGTALLLPALSRVGRDDLAYALLQEFADASAKARGLQLGALGEWMYDAIGGIALDPDAPAGRHVLVRPRPGKLTNARASFTSLYGPIEVRWVRDGRTFRLAVDIPVGSSATVWMPYPGDVHVTDPIGGNSGTIPITARAEGDIVKLGSGHYELVVGAQ